LRTWVLLLVLFVAAPAGAAEVTLEGPLTQGGLVVGRTGPGGRITLDGKPVRQGRGGHFLLGFGRDAAPKAVLVVTGRDGTTARRVLMIKKRSYRVQRIDGLARRKVTPSPADLARIREEKAALAAARRALSLDPRFLTGFAWPVRGRISGVYGSRRILNGKPRRPHFGLDLAAPEGTPVKAPADGVVLFAHPGMFFNGKTVILDHGLGLTSAYLHLSAVDVAVGQRIARGARIGAVGHSGRATGPHLHWGVRLGSTELDPVLLLGDLAR
jgi:murein DD-endopeptidase MepM/ murein hydrolase activator NlpD